MMAAHRGPMSPSRPAWWWLALPSILGCQQQDRTQGTVLLVVMDGVRLEESLGDDPSSATGDHPSALMPVTWDRLLPAAVRSTQAWNLGATSTTPAHAAMLAGSRIPFANYPVYEDPGLYRPDLPSILELVNAQADGDQALLISNTSLLEPLEHSAWPGLGPELAARWQLVLEPDGSGDPAEEDAAVLDALREALLDSQPSLAVVNLHKVDRAGHYGDRGDYPARVEAIDQPLADLWRWLGRQRAYAEDTWMIVVSDHGRHDSADTDPSWRHHGCACNGCRRLPFLLLGPGVHEGQDLDDPVLLTDLAPTMAALLGVELPWATGLVLDEAFEGGTGVASRQGLADLAVAGGHRAELRYRDDRARRSELWLDGVLVSSPDALVVEAPSMAADGDRAWLCFRELSLEPEAAETVWRARCLGTEDAGWSWEELEVPEETVGPYWSASMLPTGEGGLLMAYGRNPYGLKFGGVDGVSSGTELVVARWDDGTWERTSIEEGLTFPVGATLVMDEERLMVAVGAGRSGPQGRHTRDVYSASLSSGSSLEGWSSTFPADLGSVLVPGAERWRMEHPALRPGIDGRIELAAVGYTDQGTRPVLAESLDRGQSWRRAHHPDLPGQPLPQLPPVWLGDRAVFAVLADADSDVQLCAVGLDAPPRCLGAGSARVSRLAVDGEGLYALVDRGLGAWELLELGVADFGG
jgi:hypothetical protein